MKKELSVHNKLSIVMSDVCMCKEQYEVFSDFVIAKMEHVEVVIPYLTCSSLDQGFLTVLEL